MNEQMRRRLAFPQVTCCFGLAVALEDTFALVTMEIIMLHRTLAKKAHNLHIYVPTMYGTFTLTYRQKGLEDG